MKKEESDGERSDADLVVDDDESKAGNGNGIHNLLSALFIAHQKSFSQLVPKPLQ